MSISYTDTDYLRYISDNLLIESLINVKQDIYDLTHEITAGREPTSEDQLNGLRKLLSLAMESTEEAKCAAQPL